MPRIESLPNPKTVAAGRRNRKLRGPLTPEGRERLRQAALANRPWTRSTGPKTQAGKAKSAANGAKQRKDQHSARQTRASVTDVGILAEQMARLRWLADSTS